jgi:hypothetical protein
MLAGILVQFMLRCAFGLVAAMSITSSRLVTSGFFRIQLWVVLGFNTLAALAIASQRAAGTPSSTWWLVVAAAVLSYVGSVLWLYERASAGRIILIIVSALDLVAAVQLANAVSGPSVSILLEVTSSGLALGFALAAMLLGHWYLNTPTMELGPLRRLLIGLFIVAAIRGLASAWNVAEVIYSADVMPGGWWSVMSLRWLAGIIGVLSLTSMAWQTLRIPNTQSATGILYVVVVFVFLGELSSHWLAVATT